MTKHTGKTMGGPKHRPIELEAAAAAALAACAAADAAVAAAAELLHARTATVLVGMHMKYGSRTWLGTINVLFSMNDIV